MEDRVEHDEPTQTMADGLTRLATSIVELLGEQAIDSRLGAKLLKRLEKKRSWWRSRGRTSWTTLKSAAFKPVWLYRTRNLTVFSLRRHKPLAAKKQDGAENDAFAAHA